MTLSRSDVVGQTLIGLAVAVVAIILARIIDAEGALYGLIGAIVVVGSLWFATTRHVGLALALLMVYLGALDGYLKLSTGQNEVSGVRDVLLYALVVGVLVRAHVRRRSLPVPPMSGWVIAFAAVVLIQVFNPSSGSLPHSLGGVRQHLEFVPLFFLAYAFVRTTSALRLFVVLLLVLATLNGIVSVIQFNLDAQQLASWGPGYAARVQGQDAFAGAARTFADAAGEVRVRPLALGSEAGSGGLLGALAVSGGLALAAIARRLRYRLLAALLTAGAVTAVVMSQGRGALVCAVISVVAYGVMTATSRRRTAAVLGIAVAGVACYLVVSAIVASEGSASFRYTGLQPASIVQTTADARGGDPLEPIGAAIERFPLGAGLAVAGPASGEGGGGPNTGRVNAESEFSFLVVETGVPGLLVLVGFTLAVALVGLTRCRREPDGDARLLLAAVVAPIVGMLAFYFPSPITATVPTGPYLWTAGGIVAYWLLTRQRELRLGG